MASLEEAIAAEPVERKFLKAIKGAPNAPHEFGRQLAWAMSKGMISLADRLQLEALRELTIDAIGVDDFEPSELQGGHLQD